MGSRSNLSLQKWLVIVKTAAFWVSVIDRSSGDWFARQKTSPQIHDHLLINQLDEGPGLDLPNHISSSLHQTLSCLRHIDPRGAPVAAYWAWHCSMVTTLIVNIWEVLAIPELCAEGNVVICHNVSEEISISQTLVGGRGEGRGSGGLHRQHYLRFLWGGGRGWTAVRGVISGQRDLQERVASQRSFPRCEKMLLFSLLLSVTNKSSTDSS